MFEHEFQRQVLEELRRIRREICHESAPVTSFTSEIIMPFQAGATAVIDFTPQPAGAKLASGDVPTITSSDPTNAPVTADETGLIATVVFPSTATVGESVTISINYTNPDGDVATGSFTDTIAAPAVPDVTGFTGALVS